MKKPVSIILAAVVLLSLIPFSAFTVSADDYVDEQGVTYTLSDDGTYYIVSDFDDSVTEIVIPETIAGVSVTEIGHSVFYYDVFNTGLITNVRLPDTITSIGYSAFQFCAVMTEVNIPDGVTYIGSQAFLGCGSLTEIYIPASVTTMERSVFQLCYDITDIYCGASSQPEGWDADWLADCGATVHWGVEYDPTVGDDDENIGLEYSLSEDGSYYIVTGYTGTASDVVIPAEYKGVPVEKIAIFAFSGNTLIENVLIPDSVSTIGDNAFSGCRALKSINIPEGVKTIGYGTFAGCDELIEITLPDSLVTIGDDAFNSCYSLTNVVLPNGVTSIGDFAFYGCTSLTSIVIPDSVTSIGSGAFYYCYGLTSITIPDGVTSVGNNAFNGCDGLIDIYCKAESQPDGWDETWLGDCGATVHWGYDPAQGAKGDLNTAISNAEDLVESDFEATQWRNIQTALEFAKAYDSTDKSIEDINSVKIVLEEIVNGASLIKGDADRNGEVDQYDYLLVKRGYFNTYTLYSGDMLRTDVDGGGAIDQIDYLLIKRAYFGTYTIE